MIVPSVTQILGPLSAAEYRGVPADVMEAAAQLGTAVHKLIELDVRGELDEDSVTGALLPYLGMWREFRAQSGFEPAASEWRVHSARYGYAGTLDLFGRLNDRWVLIDAKRTAKVPRIAGPQTAGYEIALRESAPIVSFEAGAAIDRYALHLTPERWQLVPFRSPNDSRVFLSALTVHTFLENAA
ncbi:hypothetical protein [Dokdonella soli]|uniref:hypothetical protein n=1 Tax=Dokdonella soli TaxID=529810 RepID=UPI0031DF6CF4